MSLATLMGRPSKIEKYQLESLRQERDTLIEKLNVQINDTNKANEQINLLRFKVEVLLQMLSMEEKKYESTAKKLEALKWAIASNCLDEIPPNEGAVVGPGAESNQPIMPTIDISGALSRMQAEFSKDCEYIIMKFASSEGELPASLAKSEFVNTLISVTSSAVSIADIEALAIRFYDGGNDVVSVSEFLEYFITSSTARQAKSAFAAVRNSVSLLEMTSSGVETTDNRGKSNDKLLLLRHSVNFGSFAGGMGPSSSNLNSATPGKRGQTAGLGISSRRGLSATSTGRSSSSVLTTNKLEVALLKLVTMWSIVSWLLEKEIMPNDEDSHAPPAAAAEAEGGQSPKKKRSNPLTATITTEALKHILLATGGTESKLIQKHNATAKIRNRNAQKASGGADSSGSNVDDGNANNSPKDFASMIIEFLTTEDVDLIVEKFELAGLVNRVQFLRYFGDISTRMIEIREELAANGGKTKAEVLLTGKKTTGSSSSASNGTNTRTIIAATASPFRASSEWSHIIASAHEAPLDPEPLQRSFEESIYASEVAEAVHKNLPPPTPLLTIDTSTPGKDNQQQPARQLSATAPDDDDKKRREQEEREKREAAERERKQREREAAAEEQRRKDQEAAAAEAERKRKQQEKDEEARRQAAAAAAKKAPPRTPSPKPAPAPTPAPAPAAAPAAAKQSPGSNRILEAYSKAPQDFEKELRTSAVDSNSQNTVSNSSLMSHLDSRYPAPGGGSGAAGIPDKDVTSVLLQLSIPQTTGMPIDDVIAAFRRILVNYTSTAEHSAAAAASKSPIKPVAAAPAPLTAKEQSEEDAIDNQIKAHMDLLSSASPIVLHYKEDTTGFNTALVAEAKKCHAGVEEKNLFLTKEELSQFLTQRQSTATASEIRSFVTSELGGEFSSDGKIPTKELKIFMDHEATAHQSHINEIKKLEEKKKKRARQRAEIAANGGKPLSLMSKVTKMLGFAKKSPTAAAPAQAPVPEPIAAASSSSSGKASPAASDANIVTNTSGKRSPARNSPGASTAGSRSPSPGPRANSGPVSSLAGSGLDTAGSAAGIADFISDNDDEEEDDDNDNNIDDRLVQRGGGSSSSSNSNNRLPVGARSAAAGAMVA